MIRCVTYALMLASLARAWRSLHILRQAAGRVVRLNAAANDVAADARRHVKALSREHARHTDKAS